MAATRLVISALLLLASCGGDDPVEQEVLPPPPRATIPGPAGTLHLSDGGAGSGVPIVFVHGYGGSTGQWSAQLDHFRIVRRAIALDLRGHGRSSPPPAAADYTVEGLAADIAAVVDSLALERFVLVGHSMGGSAAMAYAAAHPDRVAGLVMVGAPGRMAPEQGRQVLAQIEANYDSVTAQYWDLLLTDAQPGVRTRVMSQIRSVPKEPSLVIFRALMAYDPVPALAAYRGPKLAIHSGRENTPSDLHNSVAGLPHKVIAPASHWPHMDKPEEFNRLLDAFLASLP